LQPCLQFTNARCELLHLIVLLGAAHAELRAFVLELNQCQQVILNGAIGDQRWERRQLTVGGRVAAVCGARVDEREHSRERRALHFEPIECRA